jgi:kynurenine formamidase
MIHHAQLCGCKACGSKTVTTPLLGRRRLLGGLGLAAGAILLNEAPAFAQAALNRAGGTSRIIDLTQTIGGRLPVFPGNTPFTMKPGARYQHGYRTDTFEFGDSSTGTNLDSPAHFFAGRATIEQIGPDRLVAPAVVIDIRERVARQADYGVTLSDLRGWETAYGQIPPRAFVIANGGWSGRFNDPDRYFNADADGTLRFPGFMPETAEMLIERDAVGAGVDTISADVGSSRDYGFHTAMLGAGRYLIEGLANLDALPPKGSIIVAGVLPIQGAAQSPARVIAMLE